jgi:hypothetical protein
MGIVCLEIGDYSRAIDYYIRYGAPYAIARARELMEQYGINPEKYEARIKKREKELEHEVVFL